MKATQRTFFCRECRHFNRFSLPADARVCEKCGSSLIPPYTDDDFQPNADPGAIRNWLKITKTRYFGLPPKVKPK
ncbi:MAG: hypothetical protein HYY10_01705 [Candidatus Liptonbacteria bacterium]|nr:hypothetical protein [Candidatus Liptonbacteria bacterium]